MASTIEYLLKHNVPLGDWYIYLRGDDTSEEPVEGIDQHWLDRTDERQSHEYVLALEKNIWIEKYLVGLKCYQVKLDLGHGNFERWKNESPVSGSTIENRMRYAKKVLWKGGIVKQGKEPTRKQILKGVKFLQSNPLIAKDLCLEIEKEIKYAQPQEAIPVQDMPSQNEVARAGQEYLRLVDILLKHFSEISDVEKNELIELMESIDREHKAQLDHAKTLAVRHKLNLGDFELEETDSEVPAIA